MSASGAEIQEHADAILELMGRERLRSGQMVIHFNDGVVQRVEVNHVFKPKAPRIPDAATNGAPQKA